MKKIFCENCGSSDLSMNNGYLVCDYCHSKFVPERDEKPQFQTEITLDSDVNRLLGMIKTDPAHSRRYVNLILDIDPTNKEILKYL
ncbi:TFIIB-type zinc finger domain-containing protein [Enterococcus avium]|uniref:TFIIB-type zinc finger domain-containing protein n=1 Tax=Enterococcus avium TaxID=33945 RepID=UPI0032E48129